MSDPLELGEDIDVKYEALLVNCQARVKELEQRLARHSKIHGNAVASMLQIQGALRVRLREAEAVIDLAASKGTGHSAHANLAIDSELDKRAREYMAKYKAGKE
jgi:hypothetical protein